MFTPTEQFITQMKFRELRVQRDTSLAAYDALARRLAEAEDDATRLRVLYEGLQQLRFAKQPIHPDVINLEMLLHDLDHAQAPSEIITFWARELEQELRRGRLRSEVVYIFGALLEEWAASTAERREPSAQQRAAQAELVEQVRGGAQASAHEALLDGLFAAMELAGDKLATAVHNAATREIRVPIGESGGYSSKGKDELDQVLGQIQLQPYRLDATRAQARRFAQNPTLGKELRDALTILLDHLDEWDWPAAGVPAQARWAGSKWRLFLDEDLPTSALLEVLGKRWQRVFTQVWAQQDIARLERLKHLTLEATAQPGQAELLAGRYGRGMVTHGVDIWLQPRWPGTEPPADAPLNEQMLAWGDFGSIFTLRATVMKQLRDFDRMDGYGADDKQGWGDVALSLINAEIELARAAYPDAPLYVVKVDLKGFYPSMPHDLILGILARYGLAAEDLAFFQRYLRARINDGGQPLTVERGMPNHRRLSDLLGELVLRLLDAHVQRTARVQIIRMIDDICFVAASAEEAVKAWEAVQAFCAACGLALNLEKCGAVCIGGELPADLPAAEPRWMLLQLDRDGAWRVHQPAFEAYLEWAREQMREARTVIARTQLYNASLRYLEQALALKVALGETHRQSVREAIQRFHYALFSEQQGIVESLRQMIRERFLDGASATHLPDAWLYWPITAGGLGLRQAVMRTASYEESFRRREQPAPPQERPQGWQRGVSAWSRYYSSLVAEVKPIEPTQSKLMEALVKDFISRGADLSSGKQKTLSVYWRWVLYLYGPQMLEAFGTFRFLFTELVPLQLITERGLPAGETSEEEFDPDAGVSSDDIPF